MVNPDRKEALVNWRAEGKYIVVEKIGAQFTLRAGPNQVACIFNEPALESWRDSQKKSKKVESFSPFKKKVETSPTNNPQAKIEDETGKNRDISTHRQDNE